MSNDNRWVLPEGIEELLPEQAAILERARRQLLDLFCSWGYLLVMPPLVEYVDSLMIGTGTDLELQTFRLSDQMSGRQLGIRADMTPQVARIDAHNINQDQPTRLCYIGTVLHTLPETHGGSRAPMQVGAELYGHNGVESDLEIILMMVKALQQQGIDAMTLDLGHVGIYRTLVAQMGLNSEQQAELFDVVQRKAAHEIVGLMAGWGGAAHWGQLLTELVSLGGGIETLSQAKRILSSAVGSGDTQSAVAQVVMGAIEALEQIAAALAGEEGVSLHFDLTELRGYRYHTGIIFSVYHAGFGQSIAQGGRYDDIGQVFGRARPATGFSLDLKQLLSLGHRDPMPSAATIYAPAGWDRLLVAEISRLRQQGCCVIQELPGQQGDALTLGCSQRLIEGPSGWQLETI